MKRITLGGERIGSGKKNKVELHGYERSTHNLGKVWRSTMSAGTLVPFMKTLALPGDTFDISLDTIVKTHPTIGPLFGSYKVQLDVFEAPFRLYQGELHNNKLKIGLNMSRVKLPLIKMWATEVQQLETLPDVDNCQINPSCILKYLGISGVGFVEPGEAMTERDFNAIPWLAYWDIYKNYYSNKQEEIGAVIHTPRQALVQTVSSMEIDGAALAQEGTGGFPSDLQMDTGSVIVITYTGTVPKPEQLFLYLYGNKYPLLNYFEDFVVDTTALTLTGYYRAFNGIQTVQGWGYPIIGELPFEGIKVQAFALDAIDFMREAILEATPTESPYYTNDLNLPPYSYLAPTTPFTDNLSPYLMSQEGLALKTYQSDLFNNWLSTEWIEGANGINEITSIDTSSGSFTIDTLILAKKVYNMLNRIAISDGTYGAWLETVYDHERFTSIESPVYHGGLIKELVFNEVVSNSESAEQPLGTLAGRGVMANKHKGGNIYIKVNEPGYIIGIISLTPRIDYSQGNDWDIHLKTMDDLHKPALDEIGFQDLTTEQMAWWDTYYDFTTNEWVQKSAGKQPAWINYMTDVNKTYGNFAIESNEMFMTLNRRYEKEEPTNTTARIKDLTTYIDPSKFNNIFADTQLDSQNFWVQIGVDITARRKMSARIIPNL